MARPKRTVRRTGLNLDLTPGARERLERLDVRCEADSLTEAVRRAVAALERLAVHERMRAERISSGFPIPERSSCLSSRVGLD